MLRMYMTGIPVSAWPGIRALVREAPGAFLCFDFGDGWAVLRGDAALVGAIQARCPQVRMRESVVGRVGVQDLMGPISYGCA